MLTTIALVDDHALFRSGLNELINGFEDYEVILQAKDGEDFSQKIAVAEKLPDLAIIDLHMPKMDGFATVRWMQSNCPGVRIIILSMSSDEKTVLRLIKTGVRGYILKDSNPEDFKMALKDVRDGDFHYPAFITHHLLNHVKGQQKKSDLKMRERDIEFLELVATDLTYKEIADKMNVGVRTIDGYRDQLFDKYNIKSRVGLVIYALKNNLIKL